jgi:hypothetical protein
MLHLFESVLELHERHPNRALAIDVAICYALIVWKFYVCEEPVFSHHDDPTAPIVATMLEHLPFSYAH